MTIVTLRLIDDSSTLESSKIDRIDIDASVAVVNRRVEEMIKYLYAGDTRMESNLAMGIVGVRLSNPIRVVDTLWDRMITAAKGTDEAV